MEPLRFESPVLERPRFRFAPGRVTVRPGAVTVLMGANGSGKSTALRVAAGLAKPSSGAALVDGIDVATRSPWQRAARIAFVPQRTAVAAPFTVREVVELGRVARPSAPERVDAGLHAVGLANRAHDAFGTLSGGQQQRVALARALAQLEPTGILFHISSATGRFFPSIKRLFLKFKNTFLPPLGSVPPPTWNTTDDGQLMIE